MSDTASPDSPDHPLNVLSERNEQNFALYRPLTDEQAERYDMVRNMVLGTAQDLLTMTDQGREQSVALTKLEEAMMWAHAAIAREPNPMTDTAAPSP